ncbi:hypothetical protein PZ739_05830 [Pseudomonas kermanshahensis]|uniref:hypothetical protein n=1 Tax=Pseudomonas kermanshahensis TaxID=2745482 RepID=UPI0023DC9240|nr:hypothetical protein [Pseudomonas kermanshahensis]WEL56687.1 hypothetical protein PZ739_05830 [Pseudomonas kermanshahensis]
MPVPQLATARITDLIERLSEKATFTRFEVRAVESEIEKLQKVSAVDAFMLSGMLHAAIGNYDMAKAQHEKSLLLPHGYVELVNYGISMRRVRHLYEAKELFQRALERNPGSVEVLHKYVQSSTFLMDYTGLDDALSRFTKASPETDLNQFEWMETTYSILDHLKTVSIDMDSYKIFGQHVQQVVQEFLVDNYNMHEKLGSFEDSDYVYVEMLVKVKDSKQITSMNDRLADLVLSDDKIECWDKVVINFVSKINGEKSAA